MKPFGRSLSDFGQLAPAEELILSCCQKGDVALIATERPDVPTNENLVRAGFLRFLLLGGDVLAPVHELGVQIRGAYVEEVLNLRRARVLRPLDFQRCFFACPPILAEAQLDHGVVLDGCSMPGLEGGDLSTAGPILLCEGFESKGVINLSRAHILGPLSCRNADLDGKGCEALRADGAVVNGSIFLDKTFTLGAVKLTGAQINGALSCRGASLHGNEGSALVADGAVVKGGVFLDEGFKAVGMVRLVSAQIGGQLSCTGATFESKQGLALAAVGAVIKGDVLLKDGFSAVGEVRLRGVKIDGLLNCTGSTFTNEQGVALMMEGAEIGHHVFLTDGFNAVGEVSLLGARIDGQLICSGASLDGNEGSALVADGIVVKGNVYLDKGFKAVGMVRLASAQIDGQLICSDASLDGNEGSALVADGVVVKGGVYLDKGFKAVGMVRLVGAQIDSHMTCIGASLDGKGDYALFADRTVVKGNVVLGPSFNAMGEVRLLGAQIDGQLTCSGATLCGNEGSALTADGAVIKGEVFLDDDFKATGAVNLRGAQIDGQLTCSGGTFEGMRGKALSVEGTVIKGSVNLNSGFKAVGEVTLNRARIDGQLSCNGADFDGRDGEALSADGMRVAGVFFLQCLVRPLRRVSLAEAHVHTLVDDEQAWGGDLLLNGFVYECFAGGAPTSAIQRLKWLDLQYKSMAGLDNRHGTGNDFCPQPWRRLQHVMEVMGHAEDARQVVIAFEWRLRRVGLIGKAPSDWPKCLRWLYTGLARCFHAASFWLVGYGYRPMRLLAWFLGTWFVCAAIYWHAAARERVFAPSNPLVFQNNAYLSCRPDRESAWRAQQVEAKHESTSNSCNANDVFALFALSNLPLFRKDAYRGCRPDSEAARLVREGLEKDIGAASTVPVPEQFRGPGNWYLCGELREEYTGLSPLAFSLDVLLPLVDLQQEKDWAPLIPTPRDGFLDEFKAFGWKQFVRLVIWFETLFGWLISLLLVSTVSGLMKRRD